jgi:hypothetical protein
VGQFAGLPEKRRAKTGSAWKHYFTTLHVSNANKYL